MTITSDNVTSDNITTDSVEPDQPQPLGSLLTPAAGMPGEAPPLVAGQVVTCDDQDIVILGASSGVDGGSDADLVEILTVAGILGLRPRTDTATPVGDPVRRERILRLALSRLAGRYRETRETLAARQQDVETNARVLSGIRNYLIRLYRDDDLSEERLDDFLDSFNLPAYRPSFRVEYTITGSYVVIGGDADDATADGEGYLRPDLSRLDRVDPVSGGYSVDVNDVEELDDDA